MADSLLHFASALIHTVYFNKVMKGEKFTLPA